MRKQLLPKVGQLIRILDRKRADYGHFAIVSGLRWKGGIYVKAGESGKPFLLRHGWENVPPEMSLELCEGCNGSGIVGGISVCIGCEGSGAVRSSQKV